MGISGGTRLHVITTFYQLMGGQNIHILSVQIVGFKYVILIHSAIISIV